MPFNAAKGIFRMNCSNSLTRLINKLFSGFCMIYKRVTDDEASRLFYFLQKFSREWPLLRNITWEENGAIFTDITYGGYVIIIIGLIIGQCSGELQQCRKTENFFLIMGALLFIAAGSLELAALESVEERLVDNAAILGVFSLLTGFLFIIDFLSGSKRRKSEKIKIIKRTTQSKLTQTEDYKKMEAIKNSDLNGNIQNGRPYSFVETNGTRIPKNAVKLLPSSPILNDNSPPANDGYPDTFVHSLEPPVIDSSELKTHEGKIKSTESFLRSEKGLYPKFRQTDDSSSNKFYIPTGYALVPSDHLQLKGKPKSDSGIGDSPTPPGYAKIIPDAKSKQGYVIIPIDQNESKTEGSKKYSTQFVKSAKEIYYVDGRRSKSPKLQRSASNLNSSDVSDCEDPRHDDRYKYEGRRKNQKFPHEYLEIDSKGRKYFMQSEDSSDEPKLSYPHEVLFRPDSQPSLRSLHGSREWRHYSKGKINEGYDDRDNDYPSVSRRNSPYRSRTSSPEKPKSILRFDYGRSSKVESELNFPKDIRYDSLDSRKIAEDLRNLKEITNSDVDLTRNLEKENRILKEHLRLEKEKLKQEMEDRLKMEKQIKDSEEEKNRRISEREEQYFGIKDLKQSHKESNLEATPKLRHLENYITKENEKVGKGAREINERLKEKHLEHENKAAKEAQEFRDLIDERFHFLHEEDSTKKKKGQTYPEKSESAVSEMKSTPEAIDHFRNKSFWKTDSDETNYSQSTDEEIRLRVETPGSASYKSEALFWLGSDKENQNKASTPTSPTSPGYVLYTAKNWPDTPSPENRFQFSAKEAQELKIGTPPKTPIPERIKIEILDERKSSQKQSLLDFEESPTKSPLKKGLLVRKVDFSKEPVVEIKKSAAVAGSTSTWRRWLQPKSKLQHARSVPN